MKLLKLFSFYWMDVLLRPPIPIAAELNERLNYMLFEAKVKKKVRKKRRPLGRR
jgi:hypothetical protein